MRIFYLWNQTALQPSLNGSHKAESVSAEGSGDSVTACLACGNSQVQSAASPTKVSQVKDAGKLLPVRVHRPRERAMV